MNLWALLKKIASHGTCSWHFCLDNDQFQMATAICLCTFSFILVSFLKKKKVIGINPIGCFKKDWTSESAVSRQIRLFMKVLRCIILHSFWYIRLNYVCSLLACRQWSFGHHGCWSGLQRQHSEWVDWDGPFYRASQTELQFYCNKGKHKLFLIPEKSKNTPYW